LSLWPHSQRITRELCEYGIEGLDNTVSARELSIKRFLDCVDRLDEGRTARQRVQGSRGVALDDGTQGVGQRCDGLGRDVRPLLLAVTPETLKRGECWALGRGRKTGTTLEGQRTAWAWCPAPWSSPSRGKEAGKAAANPANHPWHARLGRDGRARQPLAPGGGSPAPYREQ
jgi:hypothetical protein